MHSSLSAPFLVTQQSLTSLPRLDLWKDLELSLSTSSFGIDSAADSTEEFAVCQCESAERRDTDRSNVNDFKQGNSELELSGPRPSILDTLETFFDVDKSADEAYRLPKRRNSCFAAVVTLLEMCLFSGVACRVELNWGGCDDILLACKFSADDGSVPFS
mmetsp:Transcript_721/g.1478  ORF Transcript_721/g.1478 Transcript_721/m.1478 type:complete len:160 (+) Transcript_721:572-1051(+)